MRGTLRRRLLINALVDPDEAARRLPPGIRPHLTPAGTVVGCCLLDIEQLRPGRTPAGFGIGLLAAAHRISAEWQDDDGELVVGVYVPERRTTSRLAIAAGGRWFPGVHRAAHIAVHERAGWIEWSVQGDGFGVCATAPSTGGATVDLMRDPVAGACIAAEVGVSPNHRGALEGARMLPSARTARVVEMLSLQSTFVSGFTTAVPAAAYLMEDVAVTWTRAPAPRLASRVTV